MLELAPIAMFLAVFVLLMLGYPVAFTLAGTGIIAAGLGIATQHFDAALLGAIPGRLYGSMTNITLMAVPLFIFMGVTLQRAKIAEALLESAARAFGNNRGGVGYAVVLVGALLAASTGIVGATVVTMGLLSLPSMLKQHYPPSLACGTICATGTLGQIIPPSIALVLLGDTLSTAYQQAQINAGNFSGDAVSVGDLFVGALIPGLLLVIAYLIYLSWVSRRLPAPHQQDEPTNTACSIWKTVVPPVVLIVIVLGSILAGIATPTEAAGVGAAGALIMALQGGRLDRSSLREIVRETASVTSMVFMILLGATIFTLVFRGFGGEELVQALFERLPGGSTGALICVMIAIFLLGFILDFIEITFVVIPIVGPILLAMGIDPIWLGILVALNLQTSFLTPPFGFALFYLRGVAPSSIKTSDIYRGVVPFIVIQAGVLLLVALVPELATWLPGVLAN